MDKRYQVFVSSTYADLKEERSHVIQALMEMDCIPAGMELFPALDEEQFEFIKKVIDDCDYYLLIIGGRYGSVASDGLSYTEKEFDYAIEKGLKVIALIHENPDELLAKNIEKIPENQEKLNHFKQKVLTNRLVKFWKNPAELAGVLALSLQKTIKMYPAVGWVRSNESTDKLILLEQINELQKENKQLTEENKKLNNIQKIKNISDNDGEVILELEIGDTSSVEYKVAWKEVFLYIAKQLIEFNKLTEDSISDKITNYLLGENVTSNSNITKHSFSKIKMQGIALGYIETFRDDKPPRQNGLSDLGFNFYESNIYWVLSQDALIMFSSEFTKSS